MSKHTPSPKVAAKRIWAFHDGPLVGLFVGKEEVGTNVAGYVRADITDELLEACERAEWWLTTIEGSEAIRSVLRAAISKAEGK